MNTYKIIDGYETCITMASEELLANWLNKGIITKDEFDYVKKYKSFFEKRLDILR